MPLIILSARVGGNRMMGRLPGERQRLLRSIDHCMGPSDYALTWWVSIVLSGAPHYCYGIRSELRLCEEAHLNLTYRWFCRLSWEDEVHSHLGFSNVVTAVVISRLFNEMPGATWQTDC